MREAILEEVRRMAKIGAPFFLKNYGYDKLTIPQSVLAGIFEEAYVMGATDMRKYEAAMKASTQEDL